ncbi:hypothetical protein D3C71_669580 [compost metagenome]
MQQEDRRIRRHRIDFLDGRQALFNELMLGETAHDPHPLRGRGNSHLTLQHVHGIGKRAHAIPAQFHVEVQAAAHDVGVVVDQAGQNPLALQVDDLRIRPGKGHNLGIASHFQKQAILDGHCSCIRIAAVERRDAAVVKDRIWVHGRTSGLDEISGLSR